MRRDCRGTLTLKLGRQRWRIVPFMLGHYGICSLDGIVEEGEGCHGLFTMRSLGLYS